MCNIVMYVFNKLQQLQKFKKIANERKEMDQKVLNEMKLKER